MRKNPHYKNHSNLTILICVLLSVVPYCNRSPIYIFSSSSSFTPDFCWHFSLSHIYTTRFSKRWKAEQNLPENKTLSRCKYFFLAVFHSLPPRVVFSKLCFTFPRVKLSRSRIMKKPSSQFKQSDNPIRQEKKFDSVVVFYCLFPCVPPKKVYILELGCEKTEGFDRFRTFLCI